MTGESVNKLDFEIRKRVDILDGKIGIAFNELPLAAFIRKRTDLLNAQVLKRGNDPHLKISIMLNHLHAAVQWNGVAPTIAGDWAGAVHGKH